MGLDLLMRFILSRRDVMKKNKIKEYRKSQNLSQSDLARIMEVKQNTISQWETGERVPGLLQGLRLAEILKTSVEDLYK